MARTVITEPGQCLEDIALQEYGHIDGVTLILLDNPALFPDGFSTDMQAGTELVLRDLPVDKAMHDAVKRYRIVPATNTAETTPPPPGGGDYNEDHNNDHFIGT